MIDAPEPTLAPPVVNHWMSMGALPENARDRVAVVPVSVTSCGSAVIDGAVHVGSGLTVTVTGLVVTESQELEPLAVYTVVAAGVTVMELPVPAATPSAVNH